MRVLVDRAAKCHCKLAGESIEYTWGCSKNYNQSLKLHDKRGKEKFKAAVAKSLDREILTRERIRKFSRRACQYICTYYKSATEREEKETSATVVATTTGTHLDAHLDATLTHVEKMVKLFKTHRCAMDFDTNFCKAVFIKEEDA
jgi:hypothetical protein